MRSEYCPVGKTSNGQFCFANGMGADVCQVNTSNNNVVETFIPKPVSATFPKLICPTDTVKVMGLCKAKNGKFSAPKLGCDNGMVLRYGLCHPAPTPAPACICTQTYAPVCGADKVTYSNACRAQCAGKTVAYPGTCKNT